MRTCLLFFVFWMGCGADPIIPDYKGGDSGAADEEDDGWGSETGSDADGAASDDGSDVGDADADDAPAELENPSITIASAVCIGEDLWRLKVIADDPQGLNTISDEANCEIYRIANGVRIDAVTLACALGDCAQNYTDEEGKAVCATATDWEFHFTVTDEDGYVLTPVVVTGSVEE